MNFLVGFLMVLFIAFVLLFFALVVEVALDAKVIDSFEERLNDEYNDDGDGDGDDGDDDDDDFWK